MFKKIKSIIRYLKAMYRLWREYGVALPQMTRVGEIRWTGWKYSCNTDQVFGQLLFWPPAGTPVAQQRYFYVNLPGLQGGEYKRGECFDVSEGLPSIPAHLLSEQDREELLMSGVKKLMNVVTQADPPLQSMLSAAREVCNANI